MRVYKHRLLTKEEILFRRFMRGTQWSKRMLAKLEDRPPFVINRIKP